MTRSEVINVTELRVGDFIDWGGGCVSAVLFARRLDRHVTVVRHRFEEMPYSHDHRFWTGQNIRRLKRPKEAA